MEKDKTIMKKLLLLAVVAFVGCATVPVQQTAVVNSFVIDKPFAKVWGAAVATFAEKSLPVKTIEKDSGLITTDFVVFADGYYADDQIKSVSRRPSVLMGCWNRGRYSVSYYATAIDDNRTKISITPHIEAFEYNVTKSWHVCRSAGVIEKELYDAIIAKLP